MELYFNHYRTLNHLNNNGIIAGYEDWTAHIQELMDMGLISGEWIGDVSNEPRPFFDITELGRKILADWKDNPWKK